ncbi:Uncharacterised protein [Candidatus Venteria ishoeyi]|uniref:Uncharacterized protein n=1 Tax=Candidatus Venteria ishoeyi TaxID=1899563 RepID=A0A1H6F6J6_9GAMM|nr:Uncharacterised protein [Candidatus Venteria ishoeyi]
MEFPQISERQIIPFMQNIEIVQIPIQIQALDDEDSIKQ